MTTLELPLQPLLAQYVSSQAAIQRTSPVRYIQKLIRDQKKREQSAVRAQMGYYLSLVKKEADEKGWIPLDQIIPPRKKSRQ